ncbi:hypothetical protein LCGC14_2486320 [marine sediment metagenome]|uniref:DUF2997 domain-containing protein n=1 Tax=marine sediment metagenome TaxID=412755 RepID=A0A0F9DZS7_9ZZZZ
MGANKDITIIIDEEGKVTAEAKGYKGKGCADDIDEILAGVGKTIKTTKKTDYYDKQKVRTSQHHS